MNECNPAGTIQHYCRECEREQQHILSPEIGSYQIAVDFLNKTSSYLATCVICSTAILHTVDRESEDKS